jgi:hypothetical protein
MLRFFYRDEEVDRLSAGELLSCWGLLLKLVAASGTFGVELSWERAT